MTPGDDNTNNNNHGTVRALFVHVGKNLTEMMSQHLASQSPSKSTREYGEIDGLQKCYVRLLLSK